MFRAVENRIATVRSTNLGISAFIDPFGRITQRISRPDAAGVLGGTVSLSAGPTFYTLYGDLFAFCLIAFCPLVLVRYWLKTRRQARLAVTQGPAIDGLVQQDRTGLAP